MAYRRTEAMTGRLAERREAILAAARAMVMEDGFAGLSMQGVARRSGVATGTLYRYFPSKDALCAEVVTDVSDREVALLRRIALTSGTPLQRLHDAIATFSSRAVRARKLAYALMAEPVGRALDDLRIRYREQLAQVLVGLIEDAIADRSLPPQNPAASAAFMVGAFIEGVIGPHAPDLPAAERAALAETIAGFCLRGAGARTLRPGDI